MHTNFFSTLQGLGLKGQFQLVVWMEDSGIWTVSILHRRPNVNSEVVNSISPLTFTSTPQLLDADFFAKATAPLQSLDGLLDNVASFQQQMEKAKEAQKAEQEKARNRAAANTKAGEATTDKRYKALTEKVEAFAAKGEYRQALAVLQGATEFPTYAADIAQRTQVLKAAYEQKDNSLFASSTPDSLPAVNDQPAAPATALEDDNDLDEEPTTEDEL